ncbi:ATPase [Pseudomonas sp. JS3066]|uniref:ATPase n=1 Tax=unclassified Pseudomonas TaxID=196821 RepID=UPI000EA88E0A|nr:MULTISPECIES: ATPase [unclassified Pseudomonas]AYF90288.1 ATPase [Pseudomonas sp. DY-1]WVK92138.1 ATPase [Pseudomonas sp. JS3066]
MRNDALDEVDDVPSLTTDARDRDEFGHHPVAEPVHRHNNGYSAAAPVGKGASTGPLWALVVALVVALCGLGWWSFQQISLMEQQLVATQESFARISEEAAGRIQDISGKVVATESSVTSGSESMKLQIKQLQAKVVELTKQQQAAGAQLGSQGKRVDQLAADVKAAQSAATQVGSQLGSKLDGLASEQSKLKAAQGDMAQLDSRLKGLGSDVEALKKQGNPNQAIKGLEQDLLVLRSEMDNRPAPSQGASTAEFDAFRAQMTRNISTLQSQVQNLQQQLNMR